MTVSFAFPQEPVDIDVLMAELHDAIYVLREARPSSLNQSLNQAGAAAWDLSSLNQPGIPGRAPASWPKIRKDVETSHGVAQVVVEGSISCLCQLFAPFGLCVLAAC